ncbi:hypothetical protein [Glycomyces sp. MUSA5-2]|uniref:hypothetical protein n=1 Tax=Glycomyces sp. MUSA5-2 TaxID=2053002 RepID=UPI003FA5A3EF
MLINIVKHDHETETPRSLQKRKNPSRMLKLICKISSKHCDFIAFVFDRIIVFHVPIYPVSELVNLLLIYCARKLRFFYINLPRITEGRGDYLVYMIRHILNDSGVLQEVNIKNNCSIQELFGFNSKEMLQKNTLPDTNIPQQNDWTLCNCTCDYIISKIRARTLLISCSLNVHLLTENMISSPKNFPTHYRVLRQRPTGAIAFLKKIVGNTFLFDNILNEEVS